MKDNPLPSMLAVVVLTKNYQKGYLYFEGFLLHSITFDELYSWQEFFSGLTLFLFSFAVPPEHILNKHQSILNKGSASLPLPFNL